MKCPSCGAVVEEGADLCLECGEPMGDSPAAQVARQEKVIRPPADAFARPAPKPTPPPLTKPTGSPPIRGGTPTPPPATRPAMPPTQPPTTRPAPPPTQPGTTTARKKWPTEEPEPKRCPGCGTKSHAARCPGCGTKLRSDDE